MSNLERLATADNNLIKFHVPAAHAMDPTEQPHTFTQMEELDNTYTSPRVPMTESIPPPGTILDMPPSTRVLVMTTPFLWVKHVLPNPTPRPDNNITNEDEPIAACTCNRTKNPTPNPPTAPKNGPAYNTRSQSTKLLDHELSIVHSMNPATNQAQRLAKRAFPPQFFTDTLSAVSPESESFAATDIKSGKELIYRELLKHPDYTKEWSKYSSKTFDRLGDSRTGRVKGIDTIFL